MFTDSHCHLNYLKLDKYQGDIKKALQVAREANVHRILSIMCNLNEYDDIVQIIQQKVDGLTLGMSVGVHPCETLTMLQSATIETLTKMANQTKVWAIGETGLDYYHSTQYINEQKSSFARHIHVSQLLKKPIIVHTRQARNDTIDILTAEKAEHGIMHCFTEDYAMAKKALDLGFYISFSGIVTFKTATELQTVARKIPKDRVLIETDSPYLAPVPQRGKPNEPAYVPYVAKFLAELYQMPIEDFAKLTEDNFNRLLSQYHLLH